MGAINYPRHFAFLAIAAIALLLVEPLSLPAWLDRFTIFFALCGFLHASALVTAQRGGPVWRRALFIVMAAVLSGCVPYVGMAAARTLGLGDFALIGAFVIGSAVGAFAYWLLVRAFWLRSMDRHDAVRAVSFCVAATLLALAFTMVLGSESVLRDLPITVLWWYAFSYALWKSQAPVMAANNRWRGP